MSAKPGPTPSYRVPALDGIRAYAILGVVAVHLLGASGVMLRSQGTDLGVWIWGLLGNTIDAFFIISAFVLFLPAVRRGGDVGGAVSFWIKRGARLLPAFMLTLAIVLVLLAIHPPLPDFHYPTVKEIFANAAMLQMPAAFASVHFRIGFEVNGPLWLISIVITFYLLLPLIARVYFRHALIGLAIAALITVGWKEIVGRAPELLLPFTDGGVDHIQAIGADQFPGWAFSFGLGMTGAWAYVRSRERWTREQLARFATRALPVVVLVFAVSCWIRGHFALDVPGNVALTARTHPFAMLLDSASRAALMAMVVIGPAWLARPFVNRPTARLAELSYGVYLIHYVVILYVVDLAGLPSDGTFIDFLLWVAVVLPVSIAFAYASRRWVELPVLARVKAWQARRDESKAPLIHVPAAAAD